MFSINNQIQDRIFIELSALVFNIIDTLRIIMHLVRTAVPVFQLYSDPSTKRWKLYKLENKERTDVKYDSNYALKTVFEIKKTLTSSAKTTCSFQAGSYVCFFTDVFC